MAYKIFMVYHSHIDIGYTERQEKMAIYQADFMNQAIECALSPAQEKRSDKAKFKFTAEGFWAVEQFLKKYGEEGKVRLIRAVKSGYFEITGGYLHLTELLNYDNLSHSLDYAKDFCENNGLKTAKVAMSADVNGFSYGYADALAEHGVECLITNINSHHGGAPFGKPLVPFYWKSYNGKKILVWNGLTYHKANLLGLIPGSTPIGDPGVPGMHVEESGFVNVNHPDDYAVKRIFAMVEGLKAQGYEYDFMPLMGSGLYTDNSPNNDYHCDLIEEWNKQYGDKIEIVTTTLSEFFEYLEKTPGIKEYEGDWNDWWTDGVLSTPNELRLFRNAQRLQKQIKKLDSENKIVSKESMEQIANELILYAEHTWGHSASYYDPCKLLVNQLDFRKAQLAIQADVLANKAYDYLCSKLGEGEFTCRRSFNYTVINPNDFEMETAVYLPTDFWEEANFSKNEFYILDGDKKIVSQRTFTLRGSFVVGIVKLEAKQTKQLKLVFEPNNVTVKKHINEMEKIFENEFYKLSYDDNGIKSIINNKTNNEMIYNGEHHLGQPVYEIFVDGIRSNAAGFGYGKRNIPDSTISAGTLDKIFVKETGNVFTILRLEYTISGAKKCSVEFTLYNKLSKINMNVDLIKDLVLDPEGMYIALPFDLNKGEWYLDKPNTLIKPGNQLPTTCCDYYPVERGVIIANDSESISINTLDTPMISIGKIKLWNYSTTIMPKGIAYSWLTNNKWETNFRNQCAGNLESRYVIDFNSNSANKPSTLTLEKNEIDLPLFRH